MDLRDSTAALRELVEKSARPYNERNTLAAESFRATEAEPHRGRRVASATAHIFANMPVRIRPGELLVGWHPGSELDGEAQTQLNDANEYLRTQNYWVSASEGHMGLDYPAILRDGLGAISARIDSLDRGLSPVDARTPERHAFYESARASITACRGLIRRYADLARAMASASDGAEWQDELQQTATVCDRIATEPAETFQEAIQLMWFTFLSVAVEAGVSHHCFGPGRMDQYLYPYYARDRAAGTLSDERVEALLDQFAIKCNEFDGPSMSALIMVLGGRTPEGQDATNELSYALLDSVGRVGMYFPGVDVSWHSDMDPDFVRRCVALLRNGKGQPSFFHSDVIARGLRRHGIAAEHAVDHLPSTCTETSIMGRSNPWVAWPYVNIPMCLLYAMFDGKHPVTGSQDRPATGTPDTYDELAAAFMAQLDHATEQAVATGLRDQYYAELHRPFPLLSCFIHDCLGEGKDISSGGAEYNFLQPEAVGVSNVVDGLVAARTLIEDQGRFTMNDFRHALATDFEDDSELQAAILKECPKYGNDTDWINALFAEVAGAWCTGLEKHGNRFGGPVFPGFLGWTVWIGFGRDTPATPDGRRAGSPLANSLAPCTGVALKGTPSMLLSAADLDHSRGLGGMTFNVRFAANALATDDGVDRLKGLIEGAFDLGLYQLQVNVVGADVMRAAQETPDDFADLFVRIGGYLVPFTLLPVDAQNEVIERTELEL